MWKVLKKEERRWTRRLEKRKTEGEKRLVLKESVSTLFSVMLFRNSVPWRIRTVVGILGETFWVTLVPAVSSGVPVVTDVTD